jgi:hypothetical protein
MVEEERDMKNLVLTIKNKHIEMSGQPPNLMADGFYTGYFENEHGEQMVFKYDRDKKEGKLWCGDWGWSDVVAVKFKEPPDFKIILEPERIINEQEEWWLSVCWWAATGWHELR